MLTLHHRYSKLEGNIHLKLWLTSNLLLVLFVSPSLYGMCCPYIHLSKEHMSCTNSTLPKPISFKLYKILSNGGLYIF